MCDSLQATCSGRAMPVWVLVLGFPARLPLYVALTNQCPQGASQRCEETLWNL